MTRWVLAASMPLALLLWWASPSAAHTDLISISPADESRLVDWPAEVVLVFTEPVDPRLSVVSVSVDDEKGERIGLGRGAGDAEVVADVRSLEPARTGSPHLVRVSFRVTSSDGHPMTGSSTFTVEPGRGDPRGTQSEAEVESADSAADDHLRSAPDAATSSSGLSAWAVGGVLALVLVSVLASIRRLRVWPHDEQEQQR